MNPACQLCRGACCEGFIMPDDLFKTPDIQRWFNLHGQPERPGYHYFACTCTKLKDGLCSIYPDRPKICSEFKVGGNLCRRAVSRLRGDQAEAIFKLMA